ncbi:unnamed protein product [Linum trigynum]|uniref:At2g35280-like TPR domain-containing protein n=1 Tax=Linum trigynum TaxID=586398 RepID=A0AAV2CUX5_9ROSI
MALKHTTKRKRRKRSSRGRPPPRHHQHLTNLPQDLLARVLSHVASTSISNLFNARRACKCMFAASSHRIVLEHAAILDKFSSINHRNSWSFLQQCVESGNREALFCIGMAEYFFAVAESKVEIRVQPFHLRHCLEAESGIRRLRDAAGKGHVAARYVCGMILLCVAIEEERKEGLGFLEGLRRSETIRNKCREAVRSVMAQLRWINNGNGLATRCNWVGKVDDVRRGSCSCKCVEREKLKSFSRKNPDLVWLRREERVLEMVESGLCDSCFWEAELPVFCNMLGPHNNVFLV